MHTINYRDLAMVVSSTPAVTFDPVKENVMAHQKVISAVMEEFDIMPMSFGIVAESAGEIVSLMKRDYARFKSAMARIKGKVELDLKIYWKKEAFKKEITEVNGAIAEMGEALSGKEEAAVYFDKISLGRMVEAAAEERRNFYHKEIYDPLQDIADSSLKKEIVTPRMVLHAVFLTAREKLSEFDLKVEEFHQKYKDALAIKYTGPWPPYNFVNIRINLTRSR
ncbi:hypothetical protein PTH_0430 [Pelotomaculum thermopropionicum SI]|uniref:Gas vesicle synthesis protein GvpL/GvpF n=1 Tax=Pelotomaculum thermopropionicum (strain DSM 13744 / JCM 10971 / SI) TaxID=370438 RepID=A5D584_PELTS|nr:hypothetical protein PTH_0430 [Pelotomaculum thermopropionicum SI]